MSGNSTVADLMRSQDRLYGFSAFARLVVSFVVVFFAATLGSLATEPALEPWYRDLLKPIWTPPNLAFPIAWSILFPAMAVAAWRV